MNMPEYKSQWYDILKGRIQRFLKSLPASLYQREEIPLFDKERGYDCMDAGGRSMPGANCRGEILQNREISNRPTYIYRIAGVLFGALLWMMPTAYAATITYSYDNCSGANHEAGRLCRVDDTSGYTEFSYDIMGQIEQTDKTVDGTTYTTSTTYDDAGRVKTLSYPENSGTVTYNYDGPALVSVTEGSTTYVQHSNFNQFGQNKTTSYGNGVVSTYTYVFETGTCPRVNMPWLCTLVTQKGGNTIQNLTYSYDDVANITSINDTISGNQTFSYDDLDRLIQAQGPYTTQNYSYDTIGNMLSNTRVGSYSYNGTQPHAATGAGTYTYQYDANGNMESGAGRSITYDGENRPIQVIANGQTTDLIYDGDGGRVKKTVDGVTTLYIGKLYECTNNSCKRYIYAGNTRIAQVPKDTPNDKRYYYSDHLGSSSVITLADGSLDKRYTYHPYGETNTETNWSTDNVHHKYTGQELDDSTGLYFYGARYYDPILARFISPDTFIQAPADPQTLNRYSYVRNNPIRYTDPTGHSFWDDAWEWMKDFFTPDNINVNSSGTVDGDGNVSPGTPSYGDPNGGGGGGESAAATEGYNRFASHLNEIKYSINSSQYSSTGSTDSFDIRDDRAYLLAIQPFADAAIDYEGIKPGKVSADLTTMQSTRISPLMCVNTSRCEIGREGGYLIANRKGDTDYLTMLFKYRAQIDQDGNENFTGIRIFGKKTDGSLVPIFHDSVGAGNYFDTRTQKSFIISMFESPRTGYIFIMNDAKTNFTVPYGEFTSIVLKSYVSPEAGIKNTNLVEAEFPMP